MSKILNSITLFILALSLASCSNMEMGFDEESVFYNKEQQKVQEPKVEEVATKTEEVKEELKQVDDEEESETTFSYDPNAGYE